METIDPLALVPMVIESHARGDALMIFSRCY